ncbi:glycosyltransferase [Sphingomonas nostoxanthinifaciens]|uniref:glycosyltransferase n=1 Tax=Sphingomonas nostoxanthinifaciens TaxID=2872652 RepID=UPI001CC20929|nr:glycosyltransferase [Sphingomonas nostoxanthinifaciens]UAK25706.1 glycosyltransferase [Sphingomonas nostoxanthinifaciens]
MTRTIGYYVHHHGDGHRQRAIAIGHALGRGVTLLGTGLAGCSDGLPALDLPDDRLDASFAGLDRAERPASLHYAPVDHEGIRQRTARITQWIAQERPRLLVVDVSVEIAMLARLASVPTVYVRLSGKRLDEPHLDAFRGAAALLAPFDEALDDDAVPAWIRAKTFYAPAIVGVSVAAGSIEADVVLVVLGRGGGVSDGDRWASAARATPHRRWRVIGPCTVPAASPPNLELRGWVDDANALIARAGVVVGAAGDGVVSAVLANRRPFVCLPEARPFHEQASKAGRLAALGVAVVSQGWPRPSAWPDLLARAENTVSVWPARLAAPGGSGRVAQWLDTLDGDYSRARSHIA